MPAHIHLHAAWQVPRALIFALAIVAAVYLRGWLELRSISRHHIAPIRATSFLAGLFLIWVALGSPLALLDRELLTVHMVQHLLLMTIAAPLVLLGEPLMPLLLGLPDHLAQVVLALSKRPMLQRFGELLAHPVVCWIAGIGVLVGWHIRPALNLAMRYSSLHAFEYATFVIAGLLFWWPVIQPWPTEPKRTRWGILLYLFLATLPCDILSACLAFSDEVAYPVYYAKSNQTGISVLADQQFAAALMWTAVTLIYFIPAAVLTLQSLAPQNRRGATLGTSRAAGMEFIQ
jgi:putative membrane protein